MPPTFGRAAITPGIVPHSSFNIFVQLILQNARYTRFRLCEVSHSISATAELLVKLSSEQKSLSMDSGHPYVIHVCFLTAKTCKNTFAFFDYAHY